MILRMNGIFCQEVQKVIRLENNEMVENIVEHESLMVQSLEVMTSCRHFYNRKLNHHSNFLSEICFTENGK